MELLKLLLLAANKWLELKIYRERWTLQNDIARYIDDIERQIVDARGSGDDMLADRLLQRLSAATAIPVPGDFTTPSAGSASGAGAGGMAQPSPVSGAGGGAPGRAQGA